MGPESGIDDMPSGQWLCVQLDLPRIPKSFVAIVRPP